MKRIRLIVILFAAVVLGFLAFTIFHDREPRYQGRTLSEWIAESRKVEGDGRFLATNSQWQEISRNVKQMAPEAIPLLLKWVQVRDSEPKRKITNWLNVHPFLHLHIKSQWEFGRDAMQGFRLLGDAGKSAWPTLIQLTEAPNPDLRVYSLTCLFESRPGKEILVPVLFRMSHDSDRGVQFNAAYMFHYRFPEEAEAAGVYKIFPRLKSEGTEQNPTKAIVN